MTSPAAPATFAPDAQERAAGRLALLFCATAVVGVPFATRGGFGLRAAVVLGCLAVCLAVSAQTFVRGGGRGWALATIVAMSVASGVAGGSTDVLRPDAVHQIVGWTAVGLAGGLALGRGLRWGGAAYLLTMGAALAAERSTGGAVALDMLIGPLTYVVGGTLVRVAARRGDAATERALTATESAQAALHVAGRRWDAARVAQRELHDTVLATLTMLAHEGRGVPAEHLVRACMRDEQLLRGEAPPRAVAVPAQPHGPDGPVGGLERGPGASASEQVKTAATDVRAAGFDVRVHVAGVAAEAARLSMPVAEALGDALRECLENVRRHAGVAAADVTVVVDGSRLSVVVLDEGGGFDPAAVPADRLGLRESVRGRLNGVGGGVSIWSGEGLGTSVLLSVPLLASPAEEGGS